MDAQELADRIFDRVPGRSPGTIYERSMVIACRALLIERARVRRLRDQLDAVDGPFDETELRRKLWNLVCEWEGSITHVGGGHRAGYDLAMRDAADALKEVLDA